LEWELEPVPEPAFGARIRQKTLDGVRVVDCHCDPCAGWRRRPQVSRGDGAYFGILFQLRGREVIRQGSNEAVLGVNDFVMWDSDREMEFRVLDPLHKLTLLVPKPRMKMLLGDAERYAGVVVSGSGRADGIGAEALRRLARDFATVDEGEAHAVIDPVLSLLSATLMTRPPPATVSAGHQDSFRRFCRYIELNLGDVNLAPSKVAAAHGVSLRYLHLVFAEQGTSVGQWVRQRRLSHCHRELSQAGRGGNITEVAFRWGFNDMAHFSRAFKAQYGASPRVVSRAG
jgi:AraC-like DNA-binding protein